MRFTKWKTFRNDGILPIQSRPRYALRYKTKLMFTGIVRNMEVASIISSPLSHSICLLQYIRYPVATTVAFQSVTSKMHI